MRSRWLTAATALAAAGASAAAEPVDGLWRTEANDEGAYFIVEIGPCPEADGARCGEIVETRRSDGERIERFVGDRLIKAMKPDGDGGWTEGEIRAPDDGETYDAEMGLGESGLFVEGCALLACRSQVWTRVE